MNELNYQFHQHLNHDRESVDTRISKTDFSNVMKVDNHIHLSSAATRDEILAFMKKKSHDEPDLVVLTDPETGA